MSLLHDWFDWLRRPWAELSDDHRDLAALRLAALSHTEKLNHITKEIAIMGAREDAAYQKLAADIQTVKDGWAAKDAQIAALQADNDTLKSALADADADKAAAVESALTADSEFDADKVEAADAALASLVPPAPEPTPTDGGDVPSQA